jgi:hypothetical protein
MSGATSGISIFSLSLSSGGVSRRSVGACGLLAGSRHVRAQRNLLKQFNLICPVQPRLQKFFRSLLTQITCLFSPSCPTEGRLAIVTNAGQDAMDADSADNERRLVADGEVVWSLCPALFFATLRMKETPARQAFLETFRANKKARRKWAGR